MITLIAAMDKNRVIGNKGEIPWNCPGDKKFFRENTLNKWCIVGRKTFQDLPKLKDRKFYVLTREVVEWECGEMGRWYTGKDWIDDSPNKDSLFLPVDTILGMCYNKPGEVMVIGGAEIYNLFLPYADKQLVSVVDGEYEGDAFYPMFWEAGFDVTEKEMEGFTLYECTRTIS